MFVPCSFGHAFAEKMERLIEDEIEKAVEEKKKKARKGKGTPG